MKRISLFIAALALGLFATTAATCQKTPPTGPTGTDGGSGGIVSGVINCAEAGVHNAAIHIIDDVASALATGDYVSGLVALVKQFGEGAVDCAAAEIADTASKHAAMDALEATKAQHAKAWLASRPVTVSEAPAPMQHLAGAALNGDLTISVPPHAMSHAEARESGADICDILVVGPIRPCLKVDDMGPLASTFRRGVGLDRSE